MDMTSQGMQRSGEKLVIFAIKWTSKWLSVIASGYDISANRWHE